MVKNLDIAPIAMVLLGTVTVGLLLVLIQWSAPVITPVLTAAYLATLCAPLYIWMQKRGYNQKISLLLMVVVLVVAALLLAGLFSLSADRLAEGIKKYQIANNAALAPIHDFMTEIGIVEGSIRNLISGEALSKIMLATIAFLASFISDLLFSVVLISFFLIESGRFVSLAKNKLSNRPVFSSLPEIALSAITYFSVRTKLNLVTGIGITLICLILGVDYPILWGVLAFVMSYIPYIGLFLAALPPTILALAEHGIGRALMMIVGMIIVNVAAENILEPKMTGKALSISPTIVILSFFFWGWMLGSTGAMLSMPITVAIMLIAKQSKQTQWIADIMST